MSYRDDQSELENIARALFSIASALHEISGAPALGPALGEAVVQLAGVVDGGLHSVADSIDGINVAP